MITRCISGDQADDFWRFPGGEKEDYESINECLARHVKEKLGLSIECGNILSETSYELKNGNLIEVVGIEAEVIDGEKSIKENPYCEWVRISELNGKKYKLAPENKSILSVLYNKKIDKLKPNDVLDGDELCSTFGCSNQGGMRRSLASNTLVIVSNYVKSIYDDRWDGDIFYYTGTGTKGDQDFNYSQNKTLYHSRSNGVRVHLFEVHKNKEYLYIGEVELQASPFMELQPDEKNNLRKACVFPLQLKKNKSIPAIFYKKFRESQEKKENDAFSLDDDELLRRAKNARKKASRRVVFQNVYGRNRYVAEYTKRRAKGVCHLCDEPAPFSDEKGKPYLECHHIDWVANDGDDTLENTVALCPNCHRKMHIKKDPNDIRFLKDKNLDFFSKKI
ncbi:5-methylcytosine-specific restriction enzyme A [Marinospirillum celere]|uniref:5-methylcytosine-specific restriction enzyme A n=1 Tax=Marinospirillum celere TaxID=1122252 RepID=A0A1I1DZ43_9GAMM|nr:5-methylcytosine-specific restriction enzyme A [Marinospirillum celere]